MPGITAILHTKNDALRIARAVESLRPCDEVLVIDHGSADETCALARRFGARVIESGSERFDTQQHVPEARNDWIFSLLPTESLSEELEASLREWTLTVQSTETALALSVLQETSDGWTAPRIETRMVHRANANWDGWKPGTADTPTVLDGLLLRLRLP